MNHEQKILMLYNKPII